MVRRLFSWSEDSFRGPQTLFMVHSPDSPSVDLIVAGQHLMGFDSSKSSSTASVRWTCFIDITVDGQAHSWTFFIDITVDGQRPLDLISSTCCRRPGSLLDFLHRYHVDSQALSWTCFIDITVDGQRPLDLLSSTCCRRQACRWTYPRRLPRQRPACRCTYPHRLPRRRPACRWTSFRRLVVDGQRAAGLFFVDSSSTASVPLDFLFVIH